MLSLALSLVLQNHLAHGSSHASLCFLFVEVHLTNEQANACDLGRSVITLHSFQNSLEAWQLWN